MKKIFLLSITLILSVIFFIGQGGAKAPAGTLTLVPIDDRPAVGQFAQMIGAVADYKAAMPPREMLGNFTTPGETARIDGWLRGRNYAGSSALIISVDMLAFGGLVASRTHGVGIEEAEKRLEFFRWFRQRYPKVPVYAFSVIMRVAPTASAATQGGIHDRLARWAELKDRAPRTGDPGLIAELERLTAALPAGMIDDYVAARRRNLRINLAMIDLVREGIVDELILLQDDARQFGLHRQDQAALRERLKTLGLASRVPIYNGTDEGSLSLVSRAILDRSGWRPRVAVVYSSEKSRGMIAPYEDHPLEFTVESQIRAAGAEVARQGDVADYHLLVNGPGTTDEEFAAFRQRLLDDLKAGRPVALADLLFPAPHHSGADERLITALREEKLFDRFAGYAAWNTAGNTLGTAIPHANLRLFSQRPSRVAADRAAQAEAAHLEFLLNRFGGDYLYHDIVRQEVNARLREEAKRDGTYIYQLPRAKYEAVNVEVASKLAPLIEKFYGDYFAGRRHRLSNGRVMTSGRLRGLRVFLPWARTFECVIEAKIGYIERAQ